MEENDKYTLLKINKFQNRYVTDGNIWNIDKTFFSEKISLFLVINLKTRIILGQILGSQLVSGHYVVKLSKKILTNYRLSQNPLIIHSNLKFESTLAGVRKFLSQKNSKISLTANDCHQNQVSDLVTYKIKALVVSELLSKDIR